MEQFIKKQVVPLSTAHDEALTLAAANIGVTRSTYARIAIVAMMQRDGALPELRQRPRGRLDGLEVDGD